MSSARRCNAAFDILDADSSGFIDVGELAAEARRAGVCSTPLQEQELFFTLDPNSDSQIDREEFSTALTGSGVDPILLRFFDMLCQERAEQRSGDPRVQAALDVLLPPDGKVSLRPPPPPPRRAPTSDTDSSDEEEEEEEEEAGAPAGAGIQNVAEAQRLAQRWRRQASAADTLRPAGATMGSVLAARRAALKWAKLAGVGRQLLSHSLSLGDSDSDSTPEDRQRGRQRFALVLNELLETEELYVNDLQVVTDLFRQPLVVVAEHNHSVISRQDIHAIFGDVEILRSINTELLNSLKPVVAMMASGSAAGPRSEQLEPVLMTVARSFQTMRPYFKMYSSYCSKYLSSLQRLRECRDTNAEFSAFLQQKTQSPFCRGLDLEAYLIKPVQRICKYPLFFRDMLKCVGLPVAGRGALEAAASAMHDLNQDVNKYVRHCEAAVQLVNICRSIGRPDMVVPARTLVATEVVELAHKRKALPRVLVLFNDMLIFARSSKRSSEDLKVSDFFPLAELTIAPRLPAHVREEFGATVVESRRRNSTTRRRLSLGRGGAPQASNAETALMLELQLLFMAGNELYAVTFDCAEKKEAVAALLRDAQISWRLLRGDQDARAELAASAPSVRRGLFHRGN